jgi:hypothetical protein
LLNLASLGLERNVYIVYGGGLGYGGEGDDELQENIGD